MNVFTRGAVGWGVDLEVSHRENCFGHKQLEVQNLNYFLFYLFVVVFLSHGNARMKKDKAEKCLK